MIAKLAEGETPDIDPAECSSGNQSFSALITKALKEGSFDYQDPSALLKKMTKAENARVRAENFEPAVIVATAATNPPVAAQVEIVPSPVPVPVPVVLEKPFRVIFLEEGREVEREVPKKIFEEMQEKGLLEVTLFGIYHREPAKRRKVA